MNKIEKIVCLPMTAAERRSRVEGVSFNVFRTEIKYFSIFTFFSISQQVLMNIKQAQKENKVHYAP